MWQFDFFKATPSHPTARKRRRPPKKSPELPSVLIKKSEGVNVDMRNLYFPYRDSGNCCFSGLIVCNLSPPPPVFFRSLGNTSECRRIWSLASLDLMPVMSRDFAGNFSGSFS